MAYCTKCGHQFESEDQFCCGCGAAQTAPGSWQRSTVVVVQPAAKNQRSLRIAALILGLIGTGLGGIGEILVVPAVGSTAGSIIGPGFLQYWMLALAAIFLAGLIGSVIAITSPRAALKMLLATAIIGTVITIGFYIVGAVFLGIAAFLLWKSLRSGQLPMEARR